MFCMPDLPGPTTQSRVLIVDQCLDVFEGNCELKQIASVYCYRLDCKQWNVKKPMPLVTANPLVVQHEGSIFVLSGVVLGFAQSSAAEYSIDGDTWKQHCDMSVQCSSVDAGVCLHQGDIIVVTVDKLMCRTKFCWSLKFYN